MSKEHPTDSERLAWVYAGVDTTPADAAAHLTPGQMWYRLLKMDKDKRLAALQELNEAAQRANNCFILNHTEMIEDLQRTVAEQRNKLGEPWFP